MAVKVGKDDFCPNCMDWREIDENGKCKKCKKPIKRTGKEQKKDGYSDYKQESSTFEVDEEPVETDY